MIKKEIMVRRSSGDDVESVALLVQLAGKFSSTVYFEKEGKRVNGKSIMGMMSIYLSEGSAVTLTVEGEDEIRAAGEIEDFLTK